MSVERNPLSRRIPLVTAELTQHTVAVVPLVDGKLASLDAGSGTCITIAGRFFVATAAHVVPRAAELRTRGPAPLYAIASERETNFIHDLGDGGLRGGGKRDDEDIAWLELRPEHAKWLHRRFLPLERIRTFCDGRDEVLLVAGVPGEYSKLDHRERRLQLGGSWWTTRALYDRADLGADRPLGDRLYLKWPRNVRADDGAYYGQPDAPGLSGGGVWAANGVADLEDWTPTAMQLVGIEYAWTRTGVPERFLHAFQMQLWLRMLAEDIPALRDVIAAYVDAGRYLAR